MIGQKVFDIASGLDAELVVDAHAVEIFRQRAIVVINQNVLSVIDEFRIHRTDREISITRQRKIREVMKNGKWKTENGKLIDS